MDEHEVGTYAHAILYSRITPASRKQHFIEHLIGDTLQIKYMN